jgi:hypothetical protein
VLEGEGGQELELPLGGEVSAVVSMAAAVESSVSMRWGVAKEREEATSFKDRLVFSLLPVKYKGQRIDGATTNATYYKLSGASD